MALLILNRILVVALGCLLTFHAYSQNIECSQGTITSVVKYSLKTRKSEICFLKKNRKNYFVSKKCSKKCKALHRQKIFIKINDLLSQFGKPGFKMCRLIGGKPELIDLKINKKEINTDRCIFQDKSFINTDYLMKLYLKL